MSVKCVIAMKSGDRIQFQGDVTARWNPDTNELTSLKWSVDSGEAPLWIDLSQVESVFTYATGETAQELYKLAPKSKPAMLGAKAGGRGRLTATKVTKEQKEAEKLLGRTVRWDLPMDAEAALAEVEAMKASQPATVDGWKE